MMNPMAIRERNLDDVVQALRFGRAQGHKCSLLVGAGCSVTAGIPPASGFVDLIQNEFPDAYQRANPKTYAYCMAELAPGKRHDLIAREVQKAKINWGHVAIAQLMHAGYVDRVLTTNFDPLVVRACALSGIYPAIYDFASSQLLKPSQVPDLAVFYLHGQHTGFVLMNTDEECAAQATRLGPLFQDAGTGRTWVVVGYSGEIDPVFDRLAEVSVFDDGLYWVGYGDSGPAAHVRRDLLTKSNSSYFVRGFDSDSFFIQLAQKLKCFPPSYIEKPFSHLSKMIAVLAPYRLPKSDDVELDVTATARDMINRAIQSIENSPGEIEADGSGSIGSVESSATKLLMAGQDKELQALNAATDRSSPRLREVIAWSLFNEGTQLAVEAQISMDRATADNRFSEAYIKFQSAMELAPDQHVVPNNWGNALVAQAKTKHGSAADRLYQEAYDKFDAALKIKPDKHGALSNWGIALQEQAKSKFGAEADQLYVNADRKFQAALAIRPDDYRTLYNWGVALRERAKTKQDDQVSRLLDEAGQKFEAAVAIKGDMYEALYNLGNVLTDRAIVKCGDEADGLFGAAYEKYRTAVAVRPDGYLALNAWGYALQAQAKTRRGDEADRLFAAACEKYEGAITLKPDMDDAFYNWGNALSDQARTKHGSEADDLFVKADKKYAAAVAIKPNKHGALNNWGMVLSDRAQLRCNTAIADHLFVEAYEKYRTALEAKSDEYKAFYNWGTALSAQASAKHGAEADELLAEAGEKFNAALKIKPDLGEAFNSWGLSLLCRAAMQDNEKRQQFLVLAIMKLNEALRRHQLIAVYYLACAEALKGDVEAAMQYLRGAKKNGALPSKVRLQSDASFKSMLSQQKFREFVESLYGPP